VLPHPQSLVYSESRHQAFGNILDRGGTDLQGSFGGAVKLADREAVLSVHMIDVERELQEVVNRSRLLLDFSGLFRSRDLPLKYCLMVGADDLEEHQALIDKSTQRRQSKPITIIVCPGRIALLIQVKLLKVVADISQSHLELFFQVGNFKAPDDHELYDVEHDLAKLE
jgi:hypothetical protein